MPQQNQNQYRIKSMAPPWIGPMMQAYSLDLPYGNKSVNLFLIVNLKMHQMHAKPNLCSSGLVIVD